MQNYRPIQAFELETKKEEDKNKKPQSSRPI